ncbi:hypothetical protein HJC23_007288 [Cyclotella cryptica]|uniref:Uncharacterized protein n=1 Tax=Cyclotella cryptica TaxID=29204 RepID=A0ABD3Q058_9STRA
MRFFVRRRDGIAYLESQDFPLPALNDDPSSSSTSPKSKAANDGEINNCTQSILPKLHTYQKPRQIRRIPTKRKPRNYWHSTSNLRSELTSFWKEYGVPLHQINPGRPPPIPSEYILNFFRRNDLRGGIAQNGGRENVSHLLGGAKIIPGKWKEAVQMEEVKYLLPFMTPALENGGLNDTTQQQQQYERHNAGARDKRNSARNHPVSDATISFNRVDTPDGDQRLVDIVQESSPHKDDSDATMEARRSFWSKEKAVAGLYRYLECYKKYKHRPAVWMPQPAELSNEGYSELFNACSRFKKLPAVSIFSSLSEQNNQDDECIENLAGLVPFKEWR